MTWLPSILKDRAKNRYLFFFSGARQCRLGPQLWENIWTSTQRTRTLFCILWKQTKVNGSCDVFMECSCQSLLRCAAVTLQSVPSFYICHIHEYASTDIFYVFISWIAAQEHEHEPKNFFLAVQGFPLLYSFATPRNHCSDEAEINKLFENDWIATWRILWSCGFFLHRRDGNRSICPCQKLQTDVNYIGSIAGNTW